MATLKRVKRKYVNKKKDEKVKEGDVPTLSKAFDNAIPVEVERLKQDWYPRITLSIEERIRRRVSELTFEVKVRNEELQKLTNALSNPNTLQTATDYQHYL